MYKGEVSDYEATLLISVAGVFTVVRPGAPIKPSSIYGTLGFN